MPTYIFMYINTNAFRKQTNYLNLNQNNFGAHRFQTKYRINLAIIYKYKYYKRT